MLPGSSFGKEWEARSIAGRELALDACPDPARHVNHQAEFYGGISSIQQCLVIEQDRRRAPTMDAARAAAWSLGNCEVASPCSTPRHPARARRLYRDTEIAAP